MQKKENSVFSIYDLLDVKIFTCLSFQFSHLNEHKFRHGFEDTINVMYTCGSEVETTEHFPLCCHLYSPQRLELLENSKKLAQVF